MSSDSEGYVEWDDSPPMTDEEYHAICEANFQYEQALAGNLPDDSDESMPAWTAKELREEYCASGPSTHEWACMSQEDRNIAMYGHSTPRED